MNKEDALKLVRECVASVSGVPDIQYSHKLNDLGIDSLDIVELELDIASHFDLPEDFEFKIDVTKLTVDSLTDIVLLALEPPIRRVFYIHVGDSDWYPSPADLATFTDLFSKSTLIPERGILHIMVGDEVAEDEISNTQIEEIKRLFKEAKPSTGTLIVTPNIDLDYENL